MKKILLIDDTVDILENLTEFLSMEGYELITGTNGLDGLEKLNSNTPDLIITDLRMPGMDGFAFIQKIKSQESTREIPVLVFSANATPENEQKSMQLGAIRFIKKPCTVEALLQIIEATL
ncbi:MAG TPA: response regulator [Cyclobacteriaceae bacterium]|jgi:CheY-like chemotaxis protein|nr:response regulator [Cyclobacteriaceae bacterium]